MISDLERQLLQNICQTCNLKDIDINTIASNDPLIGPDSPLGIDSLDALEIVVMVQKDYGVRIDSQETSREVLQTIGTLAAHINKNTTISAT